MIVIYVGDASNVIKRVTTNHCIGNIEASALRKHIAAAMGYKIKTSIRDSGIRRVRIDLPDPKEGEKCVTEYIQSGKWRYVICKSYEEANELQWYAIEMLVPALNKDRRPWKHDNASIYAHLLSQLNESPFSTCRELRNKPTGPGVYVLYHEKI